MTRKKFNDLWTQWSAEWHDAAKCKVGEKWMPVSLFCRIKKDVVDVLWSSYENNKDKVRDFYFYGSGKLLNKYKRAAVLTFTVSGEEVLEYNLEAYRTNLGEAATKRPDQLFLKQRLAFYMGLCSILMEYKELDVARANKPIFRFPQLQEWEKGDEMIDNFLLSVYKDLFYSEIYNNRNVLTMANLFWVLTDNSELNGLIPLSASAAKVSGTAAYKEKT